MQMGKYNTFSYGSEGMNGNYKWKTKLYISVHSHGSEGQLCQFNI